MLSMVMGMIMACLVSLSVSVSDQPPPLEALRCSIIASFAPEAARGDGLPKSRLIFFEIGTVPGKIAVVEVGG